MAHLVKNISKHVQHKNNIKLVQNKHLNILFKPIIVQLLYADDVIYASFVVAALSLARPPKAHWGALLTLDSH